MVIKAEAPSGKDKSEAKADSKSKAKGSDDDDEENKNEERVLPLFVKGEHGPHEPTLSEKWTKPPKPYTEATLLRAMETAGKTVDDESLREVMKENGIGRPSTRAAIIETLFKRDYIKKIRKSLEPTPTGIELISLIREELLKSAELTGIWEKKLRQIEQKQYSAQQFIDELKQMVNDIVLQVLRDDSDRRKIASPPPSSTATAVNNSNSSNNTTAVNSNSNNSNSNNSGSNNASVDSIIGQPCPLCGKGRIIKGRTAYGCSEWKSGCGWRKPF